MRARLIPSEAARLWEILTDGTVAQQEPDGGEIIASMKRAVISNDNVEWYETCYCSPPLKHERATVYDNFFTIMETQPENSAPVLKGQSFWKYLEGHYRHRRQNPSKSGIPALRII